jgi:hypothetical protein
MDSQSEVKAYNVSVRTNVIREAIAITGSALYDFLEQVLMTADEEEDESDFNRFARETLNVLASHAEQLSCEDDSPWREPELDTDSIPFRITD